MVWIDRAKENDENIWTAAYEEAQALRQNDAISRAIHAAPWVSASAAAEQALNDIVARKLTRTSASATTATPATSSQSDHQIERHVQAWSIATVHDDGNEASERGTILSNLLGNVAGENGAALFAGMIATLFMGRYIVADIEFTDGSICCVD